MIVKNILNMKLILQVALLMLLAVIPATSVLADEHITYVHFDALGSSIAGSDSAGNLIWSEDYQPYGDRIVSDNSTGNNLWYTGKASYENFGLSYFGARWYNPTLGRFTGIDPVKYQEDNIHSFNRYAYANNNPYKFVDPDGRLPVIIIPIIAFIAKELAGEVVEQATGVQLPTVKNIGKAVFKTAVKKGVAKGGVGDLLKAGRQTDKNGLTKAGRGLQKHGDRSDSVFPKSTGNAAASNQQGQNILDGILKSGNQTSKSNRFGGKDIFDNNTGRGVRFDGDGNMKGFLEP